MAIVKRPRRAMASAPVTCSASGRCAKCPIEANWTLWFSPARPSERGRRPEDHRAPAHVPPATAKSDPRAWCNAHQRRSKEFPPIPMVRGDVAAAPCRASRRKRSRRQAPHLTTGSGDARSATISGAGSKRRSCRSAGCRGPGVHTTAETSGSSDASPGPTRMPRGAVTRHRQAVHASRSRRRVHARLKRCRTGSADRARIVRGFQSSGRAALPYRQ